MFYSFVALVQSRPLARKARPWVLVSRLVSSQCTRCRDCGAASGLFRFLVGMVIALDQTGQSSSRSSRSEEHTSELQSLAYLVCRLLLEKKKTKDYGRHEINTSMAYR